MFKYKGSPKVRFVAIQPYFQANTPFREALMDDVNIKIFDDGLVPFLSEYIVVRVLFRLN
jgi:hypothetical protein